MVVQRSAGSGRTARSGIPGLVVFLMVGCASPGPVVSSPEVSLESVALARLGLYDQTFLLGFSVRNPNAFPLSVRHVRYEVRLDSKHFAGGETRNGFVIAAHDAGAFAISVEIDLLKSATGFNTLLETGFDRTVQYELEGSLALDMPFAKPVPFARSGKVRLAAGKL